MKYFRKLDKISPQITLFYKGELLHSSIFSGILSLIYYALMLYFTIHYLYIFFLKENPTAFFFNRFVQDAGSFPLNSSSMFNFLQISLNDKEVDIDFDSVRFIGIENTIDNYVLYPDLTKYNHWIYGKCNNDTDIEGINYLINFNSYFKSACIRKYYNRTLGKYFETNDVNFRWPSLDRGCSNKNATYYGIIAEKCKNDSLRINFEKKFCKLDSEINEYMTHATINLRFIDHFADVYNYKEPFTKYFYDVNNGIFSESYTTNHLNFNPAIVKTHTGIIFEKIDEKRVYFFYQNEKVTSSTGNTGIYVAFYFWMQNTMQYYERKYQLLQDALSNVGGITRTILSVICVINYIISRYAILIDSEELFSEQIEKRRKEGINGTNIIEKQIKKDIENPNPEKEFQLCNNYKYRKNNTLSDAKCVSKDNVNYSKLSREVFGDSNRYMMEINEGSNLNKYFIYNKNNFGRNNYFYYERKKWSNRSETEQINLPKIIKSNLKNDINNKDNYIKENGNLNDISNKCNENKFNFCKFLFYVACCNRKNKKIRNIEELRYKILSEETIVENYLNLKEINKLSEFIK